ncbi:hypothetical protein H072_10324 [Dactylellina haptotyla CBS 200.50]|uniref:Glycoside hydrolase family 5 domain-containing protein n=1 Tax=Dactylellina haptotyla (strain CBS 200.50) TaxID=1284197 RepID=S8A0B2_DACHA|nr:hypothetical protein H072_10324 [Dactylellina haptotyla CBS 200.50]
MDESFISAPVCPAGPTRKLHSHPRLDSFQDEHGRHILLRGLNVEATAKTPAGAPVVGTAEFYDSDKVSYVGRPFRTIEKADEWFKRLAKWGVNIARFIVVWEALEPKQLGQYDEEYIKYIVAVIEKAREHGVTVFIDGHQDTWSRFTGGSGAPQWTFTLAGLDPKKFRATAAASLYTPESENAPKEERHYKSPSDRLWPTNYGKMAVLTMFTLFFGGEKWAPNCLTPEGENVGAVLRRAYCNAYAHLASRVKHLDNVIGFDPMNEPTPGYLGLEALTEFPENVYLHLGLMPSAIQGMALAGGARVEDIYMYRRSWPGPSVRPMNPEVTLNSKHHKAWVGPDIWKDLGVYKLSASGKPQCGEKGYTYFRCEHDTGEPINFERDYYVPFIRQYQAAIKKALAGGKAADWMFVEPIPNLDPPSFKYQTALPSSRRPSFSSSTDLSNEIATHDNLVYAPHWYDVRVLYEKALWYTVTFNVTELAKGSREMGALTYYGKSGLLDNYTAQFATRVEQLAVFRPPNPETQTLDTAVDKIKSTPTPLLIGETGVPFDMNNQSAYEDGNIHSQLVMMNAMCAAMERLMMNWTLWTLSLETDCLRNADGTLGSPFACGEGWNSEDFSVVSLDPAMTEVPFDPSQKNPAPPVNDNGHILTRGRLFGDLYKGCRATGSWVRPYAPKTAGDPKHAGFDAPNATYKMVYQASQGNTEISRTTEIFVPVYHYMRREVTLIWSVQQESGDAVLEGKTHVFSAADDSPFKYKGDHGYVELLYNIKQQMLKIKHEKKAGGCTINVELKAQLEPNTAPWRGWKWLRVFFSSFL